MTIQTVILAAGCGRRMHTDLPKVLHKIGGKTLLSHVLESAFSLSSHHAPIVIYGHQGELVKSAIHDDRIKWVEQKEQRGTGHALQQALPFINQDDHVLILYGDVPLISTHTLEHLVHQTPKNALGMLTANLAEPTGYGRIKRDYDQAIVGIVEERDATIEEKRITEINPGIYVVSGAHLHAWLPQLTDHNQQKEFYLTDIISYAVASNIPIHAVNVMKHEEIMGVNDLSQLAKLERAFQYMQAEKLMHQGVTFIDPHRFDLRGELIVGKNVTIDVNVVIEGKVTLGDHCYIKPNTVIEGATIGAHSTIGPFARIRPHTTLAEHVHLGNFVEVKNSQIESHTKVNHLSYIGDSDVGHRVIVGAGTITCNYDGANKHRTTIGDDAFIGSDTQLVAPVTVAAGSTIAAGSTVVKNTEAHALTLTHTLNQRIKQGWKRPGE